MASTASSRKELIAKARKLVPPLLDKFHKGQHGRVAVVGGSEDYTGAPYFSAMASANLGADMSHVICEPTASTVIKTYSPNLMVHPYMRSSSSLPSASSSPSPSASSIAEPTISMLSRLHVLVLGPGLGRDHLMHFTCAEILKAARERKIPVVLDADGLLLAQKRPELVQGWREVVLTPNVVEFARLAESKGIKEELESLKEAGTREGGEAGGEKEGGEDDKEAEGCARLARAFGGVTIVRKGKVDYISNGDTTLVSAGEGALKRSGGQGDTLTGCIATFLAWRKGYHDSLWEGEADVRLNGYESIHKVGQPHQEKMSETETLALAAWAGSAITRESARLAFNEKGRSMQASDLTEKVHQAFVNVVGTTYGI